MRFPSTKIQIRFKSLLNRQQELPTKQEAVESPSGYNSANNKEDNIDALDNLATKDDLSVNDENTTAKFRKKFPSPGASDENSELKPPYSYAQLIIQVNLKNPSPILQLCPRLFHPQKKTS